MTKENLHVGMTLVDTESYYTIVNIDEDGLGATLQPVVFDDDELMADGLVIYRTKSELQKMEVC